MRIVRYAASVGESSIVAAEHAQPAAWGRSAGRDTGVEPQEIGNRFRLVVATPGDYEPGRLYTAQAVDPGGPYPVLAVIEAKRGNEIAGTFTEG